MLIEDQELRGLYAAASKEHLDKLEAGLLALEQSALSPDRMNDLLREAHSLKGDSRMLGVTDAESLTHAVETLLQQVAGSKGKLAPALCDRLYRGLDSIRNVVHEAVYGIPAEVDLLSVLAQLAGEPSEVSTAAASEASSPAAQLTEAELQAAASLTAEALAAELLADDAVTGAMAEAPVEFVEEAVEIHGEQVSEDGTAIAANLAIEAHLAVDNSSAAEQSPLEQSRSEAESDLARAFLELAGEMGATVVPAELNAPAATVDDSSALPDNSIAEPSDALPVDSATPIVPEIAEPVAAAAETARYAEFIEDEELQGLYAAASAEHLATLEAGCLQLEKSPDTFNQFSELLRAAHSLKGDSRMLGVEAAETLTHQLETLLQEIERGQRPITPALCDRLYSSIDNLRQIAHGAVQGAAPQQSLDEMLAQLRGEADIAADVPVPVAEKPQPALATHSAVDSAIDSAIDTIRVASSKLDSLVTQVSELAVTKRRIVEWADQTIALSDLCEGWSQESLAQRSLLEQIHSELTPETAQRFAEFQTVTQEKIEALGDWAQQFRSQAADGGARLDAVANELEAGILNLRMLPLSHAFSLFPRLVRDLSKQQKKNIKLVIEGEQTLVDKRILEDIRDPLSHLLRNAVDHGIELPDVRVSQGKSPQACLCLRGFQQGSSIVIEISDDGRGLDIEKIKQTALKRELVSEADLARMDLSAIQALIFEPGFSTRSAVTAISGRGVGLDVVRTNVEQLKGSIAIHSAPGAGCTFRMVLKPNLATTDAMIFNLNQIAYALQVEVIDRMLAIAPGDIFTLKGNAVATIAGEAVSVAWLSDLLNLPNSCREAREEAQQSAQKLSCIVVQVGTEKMGLLVDELREQQEILLKPSSRLLKRVQNIAGSTLLSNGEICFVLNPQDLLLTMLKQNRANSMVGKSNQNFSRPSRQQKKILLVEDSLPIRIQMKRILESAGYAVTAAIDGLDGYNTLRSDEFDCDAVISDVEMPNLTGLELVSKIKSHAEYSRLPCLLITTLAKAEDRQRGLEAGADSYLTKGDFDQNLLLKTLKGLIQK